jgi:hypothetical protein
MYQTTDSTNLTATTSLSTHLEITSCNPPPEAPNPHTWVYYVTAKRNGVAGDRPCIGIGIDTVLQTCIVIPYNFCPSA